MGRATTELLRTGPLMFLACLAGCALPSSRQSTAPAAKISNSPWNVVAAPAEIQQTRCVAPATLQAPITFDQADPRQPGPVAELSVSEVVDQVLARNPSLAQMVAAWQAASAKYPQVRSPDDPMFAAVAAPASFGSNAVDPGYRFEVSQKISTAGKLALRGQAALAEASAAGHDVQAMRLQLIESARVAFYDYFLASRAVAVNEEGLRLLEQFRETALARVKAGAPQQDVLQAEVEIGRQRERAVTLERVRKVAVARLNTLMNVPPDAPLLPAPQHLKVALNLPPVETLRTWALAQRPDLKAL